MAAARNNDGLSARVSVVEVSLETLRAETTAMRGETREGFQGVRDTLGKVLDRQATAEARAPRGPNWYAVAGFVAATVAFVGSIFSLAEWRVGVAFDPLKEANKEIRRTQELSAKEIFQLRVELEVEKGLRQWIKNNAAH